MSQESRELKYASLTTLLSLLAPACVLAQSSESATTPSARGVEEITVTGSRIVRDGFDSPNPTAVVAADDIETFAPVHIADYINELPQIVGSQIPTRAQAVNSDPTNGANALNFRALGGVRTLTMLNGRRLVGASTAMVPDVNLVPDVLVKRVEVVTGGASAAYGSDAVGGVVNFILDNDFQGLKTFAEGGQTTEGDGTGYKFGVAGGTSYAGGRGHIVASAGYQDLNQIKRLDSRDFYGAPEGPHFLVRNSNWVPGGDEAYYTIERVKSTTTAPGQGIIIRTVAGGAPASLRGTVLLDANGTLGAPFEYGQPVLGDASTMIGGDDRAALPSSDWTVSPSNTQKQFYTHVRFDVTDTITTFFEGNYNESKSEWSPTAGGGFGIFTPLAISQDNPYLPENIRAQMPVGSSITIDNTPEGPIFAHRVNDRSIKRFVLGADVDLGGGGEWNLNTYYQYGKTEVDNWAHNNAFRGRPQAAADAVVVTAANVGASGLPIGSIACRSTLTNPTNGCVPANFFATGNRAALDWITETSWGQLDLEQSVAELSVTGTPFNSWAGPVSVAVGASWREEKVDGKADPNSQARLFTFGNFETINGDFDVVEGFGEVLFPVTDSLDLNAAVRHTDYSTAGQVWTWKVGANWQLTDELRFRGARSRDIRAPNHAELFTQGATTSFGAFDPLTNSTVLLRQVVSGNEDLKSEEADSWQVGFVYAPSWLQGLSLSLDYYDIKIEDGISAVSTQEIINFCYTGRDEFCDAIIRDPNGQITEIRVVPFNAASDTARGVDFEASYGTGLGNGTLRLRTAVSRTLEREFVTPAGVVIDMLGNAGDERRPSPMKWSGLLTADYQYGISQTGVSVSYTGTGEINTAWSEGSEEASSVDDNHVDSYTTVTLSQSFDLSRWFGSRDVKVYGVVHNLFDEGPPVSPIQGQQKGWNGELYDLVGRDWRLGMRVKF